MWDELKMAGEAGPGSEPERAYCLFCDTPCVGPYCDETCKNEYEHEMAEILESIRSEFPGEPFCQGYEPEEWDVVGGL